MTKEEITARICHIAWCAYQIGVGQDYNEEPTAAQLASHLDAVRAFTPELTADKNHENWMTYKLANGWRFGPVKDELAKTHPDLLPFDQLPLVEQRKDDMDLMCRRNALKLLESLGI